MDKIKKRWFFVVLAIAGATLAIIAMSFSSIRVAKENPLQRSDIQNYLDANTHIVVAEVLSGSITMPTTRSESAFYSLQIDQDLTGSLSGTVKAGRYTHNYLHFLRPGSRYILSLSPATAHGDAAYGLGRYEAYRPVRVKTIENWISHSSAGR